MTNYEQISIGTAGLFKLISRISSQFEYVVVGKSNIFIFQTILTLNLFFFIQNCF